ncbi:MAG: 2-oxo acid dehydrogenase subunit E2 [Synergistaceae bacterium]|nr:2-oxo acid dehydrogenase subunit E2 [Synergistaceae bacterium]
MAVPVNMPKLGLTMNSGVVSQWSKKEGESVSKGEVLMVVATDKLTFEVESPEEGVLLKIVVPSGTDVPVGETLAWLGQEGETVEAPSAAEDSAAPAEEKKRKEELLKGDKKGEKRPAASGLRATPLARKIARDAGVELTLVEGSGPAGRIVRKDVDAYREEKGPEVKTSPVAAKMASDLGVDPASLGKKDRVMKEDILRAAARAVAPAEDVRIPLTPMRRVIAQRMTLSHTTIPTASFQMEVDCSALVAFRSKVKEEGTKQGVKISYNHILMKICAAALKGVPMGNASLDGDEIILHGNINIGMAVAVEGGLLVPNVKGVQNKSLLQIAAETELLVEQARTGMLALDDMQGGTFTITNLGMFGMQSFVPIVNPPEACILGVNAIVDKAVVVDGAVVIRPMTILSLVADHRIVDGAEAARLLARIRELVENPWLLLL